MGNPYYNVDPDASGILAFKCLIFDLDGANPGLFPHQRAMLSFGHVSTRAQVTPAEYLRMTFERDAELVRGEIVERSTPDNAHSTIQYLLLALVGRVGVENTPFFLGRS